MTTRMEDQEQPDPDVLDDLFDYAVANPEGFTNREFMEARDYTLDQTNVAIRRLRKLLAGDTSNLVVDPDGGGPWTYRLTGSFDEAKPWVDRTRRETKVRIETVNGVIQSVVKATDGRSVAGRQSRLIEKVTRRLIEDLEELELEA